MCINMLQRRTPLVLPTGQTHLKTLAPACVCVACRGTLSSYAYVLMCINMLQRRTPPVLPSLQAMPAQSMRYSREVGQWDCTFNDNVDELRGFGEGGYSVLWRAGKGFEGQVGGVGDVVLP